MKLLLDQNLSRRLIPLLEVYFPGSSQVALLGFDKASDNAIWDYAKLNDFVIVTKDSDFEELSVLHGAPPRVIWIKLGNSNNDTIARVLIENQEQLEMVFASSEINCIEIYL
jgi:predicted nuclease of predicted toxin-antitoxin system